MTKSIQNHAIFILAEPENPDNIGAAARAIKNMGFSRLRLVKPPLGWKRKSKKLAVSARDVIDKARIYQSLSRAVKDCHLVVGTTRRSGRKRGRFLSFGKAMDLSVQTAGKQNIAIVFGKESKGLSNEHLQVCDWMMTIPVSPVYPSINLAQAVMVVAYSLFTRLNQAGSTQMLSLLAKVDIDAALDRVARAVKILGYKPAIAERVIHTFRALVKRSGLIESEAQMLKGLSRRICQRCGISIDAINALDSH